MVWHILSHNFFSLLAFINQPHSLKYTPQFSTSGQNYFRAPTNCIMHHSLTTPLFIPATPVWPVGSAHTFTSGCTPVRARTCRRVARVAHPTSTRVRWFALAGSPPTSPSSSPSPPGGDADDNSEGDDTTPDDDASAPNFADDTIPLEGRSDDGSRDSEFNLDLSTAAAAEDIEQNELFKFVKSIPPPELVKRFTQSAPPVVQKAIRETLISMLGSLPPMAFSASVSTMSPNLVQLFHSSLVTGYMFRNAAYRLELTRTLDWSDMKALPASAEQPEIKGGVAIFKQPNGSTMEVPVDEYIGELRETVDSLRSELQRERKGGNELLNFISTMEKDNMDSLTKDAGVDVVDAMKKVVDFVTKSQGIDADVNAVIEASAPELGQLLFYLMVSGFFLREAEVRLDLQRQIGGDSSLNNLLEGRPPSEDPKSSDSKDTE